MFLKVNGLTWKDVVDTIKSNNIKLADIVIHTKYPINTERIFCFSEKETKNVNVGLILHDYLCKEMILTYDKPDLFTDSEWIYLLPNLIENDLLNKTINVFYKNIEQPHIVYIQSKNQYNNSSKIWFYSNYYVHVIFKIVNDELPKEIEEIFIDDGKCINAIYVNEYKNENNFK